MNSIKDGDAIVHTLVCVCVLSSRINECASTKQQKWKYEPTETTKKNNNLSPVHLQEWHIRSHFTHIFRLVREIFRLKKDATHL